MQSLEFANKKIASKIQNETQQIEEYENKREASGRTLALTRNVFYLLGSKDIYYVQSERSDNIYYFVKYNPDVFEYCSCLDNSMRGIKCKHQFAIEYAIRLGTLKDIDRLPTGAKRYPEVITAKSYEEDNYDF